MQNFISSSDLLCWNIVLKGNSPISMITDKDGNLNIRPPVTAEEHQQKFEEFKIFEEEGLDKGYEKMKKILTQMNILKIKPDLEDVNMKFLRGLPPSWSGIALILKTKRGLEYISFDDLYNKLKFLEINTKGYSSSSSTLSNAAFVSTTGSSQSNLSSRNVGHTTTFSVSLGSLSSKGSSKSKSRKDIIDSKAMVVVDGSIDWDKQTEEGNTKPRSLENFGMIAGIKIESDADSEGEVVSADAIPAGDSVSTGDVAAAVVSLQSETEFAFMGLSTEMVYGKKATDSSKIKTNDDSITHSNDSVLFDFSDRSLEPSTNVLQTCDSSVECSRSNHSDHDSIDSLSSVSTPVSESRDTIVINFNRQEDFTSVYTSSIETDVKYSKTLCNKFRSFNKESHFRKHKYVASKSCYVCGSYLHLIKDCDLHEQRFAKRNAEGKGILKSRPIGKPVNPNRPKPVSDGRPKPVSSGRPNPIFADQPNLVSAVSQICDLAHRVLFTENECLVLSKDFPLPDPSMEIRSCQLQEYEQTGKGAAGKRHVSVGRPTGSAGRPVSADKLTGSAGRPVSADQLVLLVDLFLLVGYLFLLVAFFERNQKLWVLVTLPDGKRAIGTKWILKNKTDAEGIVCRNKVMLVAQGHRQEEGIDYTDVFAPVAKIKAIRLFLAFASFVGFMVYEMDVKIAFLYEKIDEEDKIVLNLSKISQKPDNINTRSEIRRKAGSESSLSRKILH
nr:putative ribonuclease H-like domain-containing protein [Tanacetum cinerariifolium]